jgi:transcription elongation factor GreA
VWDGAAMTAAAHDERHALLEELDLLRTRRRELAGSLVSDDHPPHDFGEQGAADGVHETLG